MRKGIAVLWIAVLVLTAICGCGREQYTGEASTEPVTVYDELPEQTGTSAEPALPQETVEPEMRINPAEDEVMEDITPFGNIPGTIVPDSKQMDFPQIEQDRMYQRILFESELFLHQVHYGSNRPVYLVDGYIQKAEALYRTIEQVTGLSFMARPSKQEVKDLKLTLFMGILNEGNPESDYTVDTFDAEGYAVYASQASALLGKSDDLIMNLAGLLQAGNAYNRFNDIYAGGFQAYTAYKVQKFLEEHDPQLAMASRDSAELLLNYHIHGGLQELMEKPMDHWIRNADSLWNVITSNGSVSVGFYFMMYLDEVYGDYCGWIPAYAQSYPCVYLAQTRYLDEQIQVMKDVYGEEVFENFYPWLEEELNSNFVFALDYSWRKQYVYYPLFAGYGYDPTLFDGKYEDMCVSLAEYRNYMTELKGYELDALTLVNNAEVQVALYDRQGRFIMVTKGVRTDMGEYRICLEDVYYIKFIGKGTVRAELRLQ